MVGGTNALKLELRYSEVLSIESENEVCLLDCSRGPTGTHKDIRSRFIVQYAKANRIPAIHVVTCGNSGLSLKKEIERQRADIKLTCIVPRTLEQKVKDALIGSNSDIVEADFNSYLQPSELAGLVTPRSSLDVTYVESPQYDTLLDSALDISPDLIAIPVGTAELFNCLFLAIYGDSAYLSKELSKEVRLVGVVPQNNSPFCSLARRDPETFLRNYTGQTMLDKLAGKYAHPYAADIMKWAFDSGHLLRDITEREAAEAVSTAKRLGYDLEPSGAASLVVPKDYTGKTIVCILTGKGRVGGG